MGWRLAFHQQTDGRTLSSSTIPILPSFKVHFNGLADDLSFPHPHRKWRDELHAKSRLLFTCSPPFSFAFSCSLQKASRSAEPSPPQNHLGMDSFVCCFVAFFFYFMCNWSCLVCFPNSFLSVALAVCLLWTACSWKDSSEAAFFRETEEENSTFFKTIFFSFIFSNEWIHRRNTWLLRSDEGWTGVNLQHLLKCRKLPWKEIKIQTKLVCGHCCSSHSSVSYMAYTLFIYLFFFIKVHFNEMQKCSWLYWTIIRCCMTW